MGCGSSSGGNSQDKKAKDAQKEKEREEKYGESSKPDESSKSEKNHPGRLSIPQGPAGNRSHSVGAMRLPPASPRSPTQIASSVGTLMQDMGILNRRERGQGKTTTPRGGGGGPPTCRAEGGHSNSQVAQAMLMEVLTQLSVRVGSKAIAQTITNWEETGPRVQYDAFESPQTNDDEEEARNYKPEAPEGVVTFVFTDIQSSTHLWEQVPEAMDEALSIHNRVMRRALRSASGYEVKTIGDAFMVAFKEAIDAMHFCLEVQTNLNDEDWPDELADISPSAGEEVEGQLVHNGLRVRMGVHLGDVIKEVNPLTGRADYRGPTVNTAARVESQGVGGQIFITEEVHAMVEKNFCELGEPLTTGVGKRTMKGVAKPVDLFSVVPKHLAARVALANAAAAKAKEQQEKQAQMDHGGTTASHSAAQFHSQLFAGLGRQLGMRMRRTLGTLVIVRNDAVCDLAISAPDELLDEQCDLIRTAVADIIKTEGQLENVQGDALVAAWNTSRACMAHSEQALRFCGLLHSRRHPNLSEMGFGAAFGVGPAQAEAGAKQQRRLFYGVGNGKVVQGTVGTARQRFRCLLGHVERLANALADACPSFGCLALSSKPRGTAGGSLDDFLRPVDIWQVGSEQHVVEEVDLVELSAAEKELGVWDFLAAQHTAGMGGGETTQSKQKLKRAHRAHDPDYEEFFMSAVSGDSSALEKLVKKSEKDLPLQLVCDRLRDHIASGKADPKAPRYVVKSLMAFPDDEKNKKT